MRYNPQAPDEDIFVAVRDGKALSRVENLSGPVYQNVEDIGYFKKMLHGALMVPPAFLGQDDSGAGAGSSMLSNSDVRSARVSLQVQRELRNGIERLIRTDFAARGFSNPWKLDFDVVMTIPSNVYELAALEVKNARADFAARIHPDVSRQWILETVYKLTDKEIFTIDKQRKKEADISNQMGMDPSFGAFTGGKPPSQEEQMGQLPPEAMPPGMQPPGGQPGQPMMPQQPAQSAPQMAWRAYDRSRRLEERNHRASLRNNRELITKLGKLEESNEEFRRSLKDSQAFMREFKDAALRTIRGSTMAVPSAQPKKFGR